MSDVLSHTLQENLITILCFDKDNAPIIRQVVTPELFSPEFRPLIRGVYQYYDRHGEPPNLHTDEIFEDAWANKTEEEQERMAEILEGIRVLKDAINTTWAMGRLEAFIRVQTLRSSILDAAQLIQSPHPDEDSISRAYEIITDASKGPLTSIDTGTTLAESGFHVFEFENTDNLLNIGIPALDYYGQGPAKGRLGLFLATTSFGKSWWLAHLAKKAAIQHWNVFYDTMELPQQEVEMRLLRGFFAISKRADAFGVYRLIKDDNDKIMDMDWERMLPKTYVTQKDFKEVLEQKILRTQRLLKRIRVKKWPQKTETPATLDAHLDMLEQREGWRPDLICLDYPELMRTRAEYQRQDIGHIYANLKRICDERFCAMNVVSQLNREGAASKSARAIHAAEDWSKIHHSDVAIVASQTEQEKAMSLARLFVDKSRTDKEKYEVLISQGYDIGQFCLDSVLMDHSTRSLLKRNTNLEVAETDDMDSAHD